MPISDPRAGSIFICLVSALLLLSIVAGGALLVIYMVVPTSEPWLPVAGVSLVSLPWFFWFLTFLYRLISRLCCGPRSLVADCGASPRTAGSSNGGCGGSGDGENGTAGAAGDADRDSDSPADSPGCGARRVRFGGAVVASDNRDQAERGGDKEAKDNSVASHESEVPLTLSMAS